jgi:hypothetical protein
MGYKEIRAKIIVKKRFPSILLSCLRGIKLLRIFLFAFLLLLTIPIYSMGDPLPQSIGSFQLEQKKSGEEARQEIYRLHGKQLEFRNGYIGDYKEGDKKAKLWISEYDSVAEATREIEKMAQGVKAREGKEFWHYREISIEGKNVYFVVGMGQAHYFFQKKNMAFWLAVDPSKAKETVRDLMEKIQ